LAEALRIPATGMIVTTGLADKLRDILPRDKKSVGLRLAGLALSGERGVDVGALRRWGRYLRTSPARASGE
jgi:hypothetical protein